MAYVLASSQSAPAPAFRHALELLSAEAVATWLASPDEDRTVLAELLLERT